MKRIIIIVCLGSALQMYRAQANQENITAAPTQDSAALQQKIAQKNGELQMVMGEYRKVIDDAERNYYMRDSRGNVIYENPSMPISPRFRSPQARIAFNNAKNKARELEAQMVSIKKEIRDLQIQLSKLSPQPANTP